MAPAAKVGQSPAPDAGGVTIQIGSSMATLTSIGDTIGDQEALL